METDWFVPTDPADLEAKIKKLRRKKAGRQFPWERGPIAWEVANRADEILETLACHPRRFFSLRQTAQIFGTSTQPLRDWARRRHIKREGPRDQFEKDELCRFIKWLSKRAEPFSSDDYLSRIHGQFFPRQFSKLRNSRFEWPKDRKSLRPGEIAELIGCHRSLILLAIRNGRIRVRRPTPCRSEITKRAWSNAFLFSLM